MAGRGGAQDVRFRAASARDAEEAYITPSDANDLPKVASNEYDHTLGIIVGVSGDLRVTLVEGVTTTFPALAAGVIHPIAATRVWDTVTTAQNILPVYGGKD